MVTLSLPNADTFNDSHPFPTDKRHHIDSLNSFIALHHDDIWWSFLGERFLCEVQLRATEPGSDDLIANYHPDGQPPIEMMFHRHTADPRPFPTI